MNQALFSVLLFVVLVAIGISTSKSEDIKFGNYKIHYNAIRSDDITPEIAKAYSLVRRNNKILVNVNVRDEYDKPAKGKVTGYAVNLSGQIKNLSFNEILDGSAIYYLAQAQVSNGENLTFHIRVSPSNEIFTGRIKFKQQFYTD